MNPHKLSGSILYMSDTGKTFKEKMDQHKKLVEYNNKIDNLIRLNGNIIIQAKAKAKAKAKVKSK